MRDEVFFWVDLAFWLLIFVDYFLAVEVQPAAKDNPRHLAAFIKRQSSRGLIRGARTAIGQGAIDLAAFFRVGTQNPSSGETCRTSANVSKK